MTSDFYNPNGQLVQTTGPTGATTVYAYDPAGNLYCEVGPEAYSQGVRCPSSPPASPPTLTSDPYLGATITTYNPEGQVSQVTNPLGGITLSTYDGDGNLSSKTVESSNSQAAPSFTTEYYYDADNRAVETVTGYNSPQAATTLSYYDPNGNLYCSVSAKAYATGTYECPQWQAAWGATPPTVGSLYLPTAGSVPAEGATTSFYDADGELVQQSNPDEATATSVYNAAGNVTCAEDANDMATTLAAQPSSSYPYACPATPLNTPPATGSDPGYDTSIYDLAGRLQSSTDAAGDTTSYTYDPDSLVLTKQGPSGQVTTNCYYWETSSCAASAPAGGGDANSLYSTTSPPSQAAPGGATSTYTYLPGGAASTTTTAAGTVTDAYDPAGNLRSVTYGAPGTV